MKIVEVGMLDSMEVNLSSRMFVLGLPTGGTPLGMYQKLVQAHKAGKVWIDLTLIPC